jgi:hypothetical protein
VRVQKDVYSKVSVFCACDPKDYRNNRILMVTSPGGVAVRFQDTSKFTSFLWMSSVSAKVDVVVIGLEKPCSPSCVRVD